MTNENNPPSARPQRKVLGRGLSALLESRTAPTTTAAAPAPAPDHKIDGKLLREIGIDAIEPNPDQPRKLFAPAQLEELAASIRAHGLLQPVIVVPNGPLPTATRFHLVAGERRWRAAKLAGLERIPALIQETPRDKNLELALIENLQREDLNPIEAASAFHRLAEDFELTHEEIAERTGKERATVTNFLRLLRLPADVQQLVADKKLSMGHARAILGANGAQAHSELAKIVVERDLSVRATEAMVAQAAKARQKEDAAPVEKKIDPNIKAALRDLEYRLGTKVRISGTEKRGKLVIEYYSQVDLLRIYDVIANQPKDED